MENTKNMKIKVSVQMFYQIMEILKDNDGKVLIR